MSGAIDVSRIRVSAQLRRSPFFPSLSSSSSSLQVDYNSKIKNRMAAAGHTPSAAMAHSYDDQQVTFGAAQ